MRVDRITFDTRAIDGGAETVIAVRDEDGDGWTLTNGDGLDYGRIWHNPTTPDSVSFRRLAIKVARVRTFGPAL